MDIWFGNDFDKWNTTTVVVSQRATQGIVVNQFTSVFFNMNSCNADSSNFFTYQYIKVAVFTQWNIIQS